jgi:putative ABC transport system ATP-binding protein
MDSDLVRLQNASRWFPPDIMALREVELQIGPGEFLAITGPSGSGKSTLLNILGLLDRPTSGTYYLDGFATTELDDRDLTMRRSRSIGFVFQAFHLVAHLSVLENVVLGLTYAGVASEKRNERARAALDAVGMSHRLVAYPKTLSAGEGQRVAIARAVARQPRLMLCDEPTGNLDSVNSQAVLDLLEATHSDERALVVVTHDPDVAGRARRVVRMRDGRLREV